MTKKVLFFLITFTIFSNGILFSQTQEELSLFEIDRLIRKTEYDEALKQLNIYLENNPEKFDNAQKRIDKIMNAKIRYSELSEELLEIIRNDPTNNKRIYEITAQLEKFERNPSDENLKFIADLKKSAEFNYFRAQFLEIQNSIAKNVQEEKYIQAVKKAQEGFWLYRDNFYIKWEDYPDIILSVETMVNDLNAHLAMFEEKNFISGINKAINDFSKAIAQDQYDIGLKRLENVKKLLVEYDNLRNEIKNDMKKMEKKVDQLQKLDPDMTDASYLPFLIHFISGSEAIVDSGILGAVNGQWNYFIGTMNNSVFAMITEKYNSYKQENGLTEKYAQEVAKYGKLEEMVHDLYDIPNKNNKDEIPDPYTDYLMLKDYVANLTKESVEVYNILVDIENNGAAQNQLIEKLQLSGSIKEKETYINQLFNYSGQLDKIVDNKDDFLLVNKKWAKEYNESDFNNWQELEEDYSKIVEKIFTSKQEIAVNSIGEIAKYYIAKSTELYTELESYTKSAVNYQDGFFTKVPGDVLNVINSDITKAGIYEQKFDKNKDLDFGLHYKYPDISIKMAIYIEKEADERVNEINGYLKNLNKNTSGEKNWSSNEVINENIKKANSVMEEQIVNLKNLKKQAIVLKNEGNNLIRAAQVAKNEGDLRFKEAEKALRNEDFSTARRKLQNALTKYDEALNNQNNENLRTEWDKKLQNLGEEIAKSENEVIVRQVRELKNQAKDAYFNGRFDDAEKYLNQASVKWSITNVTEDPEITNLMNFVNTAISMKTGREILPSAPQYPEMSQLMNIAHQSFDEGAILLKKGMKEEAQLKFNVAMDSIRKIQYVYPLNQEAALLTLEINKLMDPVKFENEFSKKIEMAAGLCKNPDTQQEGYANLLDYYKLEPNYPGLKELIYKVEIDIGIRQKPVDNSGKNKAKRYIADAQKIYNRAGDDLEELNKALEKVNAALVLLPDDTTGVRLKDKITTKMGGNASTVLSTEDERLYQMAITRLQNNNVVGAKAIVDQLLKKPQNRYSQKIKDLNDKIEARS